MEVIRLDKPNFNQLKSVKTPDSWVENALKIPTEQKKPLPLFFRPAIIGTAAGVALAAVLGVLLFMTLGRNSIPVRPSVQSTSVSQDNTTPTFTTPQGEIYVTTPQGDTQPVTTPQGQPATVSPVQNQPTSEPAGTGSTVRPSSPAVSPTQPGTTNPGATVKPTAPTVKPTSPAVVPTQAPTTEPGTEPPEPTTQPGTEPPEPVTEEPWYPWIPPDVSPYPPEPGNPDDPAAPGSAESEMSCRIYFINNGQFPEGEALTCYPVYNEQSPGGLPMQYLGNGLYVVDTGDYGVEFPLYSNLWLFISGDSTSYDFHVYYDADEIYIYY